MKPFASAEQKAERRELIRLLRETPAAALLAMGEEDTVTAFQRTAQHAPFYRELLRKNAVTPASVNDIASFRKYAPLLDKHSTFGDFSISELCTDGDLNGVRSVLTSSGHSGVFSFGVNTQENLQRSALSIDTGLQYLFNVDEQGTLLINCLPMGVKVNTRAAVLAETSVRDDMVYAVVKKFHSEFDQIIIVGEGSFLKKIIEDGQEYHDIDWPRLRVHIVTGEEGIAENYRSYMGGLLGLDDITAAQGRLIGSSMGVAELDLNIFHETRESISIRRLAHADPNLRSALFGKHTRVCPMLFVYYPHRCYVEEIDSDEVNRELVISMLSAEMKIPLLRYRSGDFGRLITYDAMVDALRRHGCSLQPDLKLPFVAVYGRGKYLALQKAALFPEEVKEALYLHNDIAAAITGNFKLSTKDGCTAHVDIQLRKNKQVSADAVEKLLAALRCYSDVAPKIEFYSYQRFPYAMEVDYERKFNYLA